MTTNQMNRPQDFGMDCRPTSNRWSDIARDPSKAKVLAHIAKLNRFIAPTK
jgi:hypothetical protein